MKKRLLALLVLALVMVLALVSCEGSIQDLLDQIKPEAEVYAVYFSTGEGSHVSSQDVKGGDLVTKPEDPTRDGFKFDGWYKDVERTNPWNFDSDIVKQNTIIYAKWIEHKGGSPTCTSGPICESCGEEYGKPLGHTEEIIPGKAATCTEKGLTDGKKCSVCDEILVAQEEVDALGHDWKDATCTTPKTCGTCGTTEGKANGHTEATDAAVAPTCTETGLSAGSHCSVCNEVLVAQTVVDALGHTVVVDAAVAPTCTATGLTEGSHCSVCNEVFVAQTVVDALGHTVVVDAAVAPTCTETGLTEGSHCSVCNVILVAQQVVVAKGHTWADATCTAAKTCSVCNATEGSANGHTEGTAVVENKVESTCTTPGSYDSVVYCSVCHAELSRTPASLTVLGHDMSEWFVAVAPTYEKEGREARTCLRTGCDHTETRVVAMLTHTFGDWVQTKAPTCTEEGLEVRACTDEDCDVTEERAVRANGHTHGAAATCTENQICTVCNVILTPATGHTKSDAVVENYTDSTCSAVGSYDTVIYCSVCSAELSRVPSTIARKEHTPGAAATCTANQVCTVCDAILVKAPGHTVVVDAAVAPTCTKTGLTEGSHCSVCNEVLVAQTGVAALGHTEEVVPGKAATCTETGLTNGKKCSVCNETLEEQKIIYTLPHVQGEWIVTTYPTCESVGERLAPCTGCGSIVGQESIPALGHKWDEGNVTTEPTCVATGTKTFTCQNDASHTKTEEVAINPDAHDLVDVEGKAATCKDDGYTAHKECSYEGCGHTEGKETVPASGHNYENGYCTNGNCGAVDPNYYFPVSIAEALEAKDGWKVQVSGTVCAINTAWSESYGNITVTITDGTNELYIYRMKTNVALGDIITVKGAMATYNGRQIDAGSTAEITGHDSSYDYAEMTIEEALAAADNTNVIVTGTVVKIGTAYSSSYNNISVYIADDNGTQLYLYRLSGNVTVGQIIKVKGSMATYSGARQVTGGTFEAVGTHECSKWSDATCKDLAACVVCGATTGELADHTYVDGVCSVCGYKKGDTSVITTASKTVAELIKEYGWTSSTTKQSFNLDDNVAVKINGGSNTGKAYNNDHIRIYATDTPAGTITITIPEGYELVSIKISTQTGTYAFLCIDGTTTDISNVSTLVSGTSVVLNSVKNGSDGKQARVTAMEVVYKTSGGATGGEEGGETTCEHTNTTETTVNATCTVAGSTTVTCTDCGATVSTEAIAALGHRYGEGVETTAPTCTEKGVKTFTCATCGDTKTEDISALGHTTNNGTCERCNETIGGESGETPAESVTASKTISELITEYGWTNSTTKQSFNLDDNVTVKINGGSNTGKAYEGNHIRIYATDTPAGTITITVPEGYELVSIKISTQTGTYAFLCVDGTTTDISNVETAVSGTSVVLNSVKNGSDGKQVRVTAMEVVYKTSGGATDGEEGGETTCEHTNTTETTTATCTEAGSRTVTCDDCGETISTEEIDALGHTTDNGTCERCNETIGGETPEEPSTPATTTASKSIADLITELGWTSSTTKQSFNLDDNVTVKINGGSNTGKAYEGNHIRIYATDTPAGTITITVPEGYELVSIKISTQTGTYAFLCVDGTTTDISNVETAVSGTSVVLNSVKNGSNGKQVRVTAIEVVYQAV